MTETFRVKTASFEGPLDLLLSLIEKRKLYINDISLAKVADDFVNYIKELKVFPLSQAAHFVLIASTLLLIKSKSLLPTLSLSEEEEGSIEDLEKRLKLFKRFKELSRHVLARFGKRVMFASSSSAPHDPVFSPAADLSLSGAIEGIRRVLDNLPQREPVPPAAVIEKVISLPDMMDRLAERMTRTISMSFREFSGKSGKGREAKVNVIISFLALLELVKQGVLSVKQETLFEDITMESDTVHTPRYG